MPRTTRRCSLGESASRDHQMRIFFTSASVIPAIPRNQKDGSIHFIVLALSFTEDVVCAFPASLPSSLTWGNCALCGEIHELLKSGDITRARKLIKDDPSLVIRKAEDGSRLCTS